jgi:hypothetical protein
MAPEKLIAGRALRDFDVIFLPIGLLNTMKIGRTVSQILLSLQTTWSA